MIRTLPPRARRALEPLIRVLEARGLAAPSGARASRWVAGGAVFILAVGIGMLWKGTGYTYAAAGLEATIAAAEASAPADARTLANRVRSLRTQLARTEPRGPYIVVDRTHNRLFLKSNRERLLQAICSVGSGKFLEEPGSERAWTFATPRGKFRVLSKLKNPVWKKPDWAFIEEGEPIPTDPGERFEYGTMGEYGLYFGDGYLIHGTLYERLLGRSVSHGCVRLGRDDLRALYAATKVGTEIYIF
jgi:L,D-transpeptidase YbiS